MAVSTRRGQIRKTSRRAYEGLTKRKRSIKSSTAYRDLERKKLALQRRYKNLREKAGELDQVKKAGITAAGGALAGVATTYYPHVYGVPTPILLGAGLVGYSAFYKGSMSVHAALLGSGMLAAAANEYVQSGLLHGDWNPMIETATVQAVK